MRRMSANNHWGQEGENFHKQAGYMRAMIFSHINDQIVLQTEWVHICIYSESCSNTITPQPHFLTTLLRIQKIHRGGG